MAESKIEWTDVTWNPVTGCDRISPGCDNCYALTMAKRLKAMGSAHYQNDGDPRTSGPGFGVTVHPDALDLPLRWWKPRRVFVNSMSDLFHQDVPDSFIGGVFDTMARTPQHTYQILTKRPQRMERLLSTWYAAGVWRRHDLMWCGPVEFPLPNVWLGTSIESDRYAFRADHLRRTPAAVRFISAEPLLGPLPSLDLNRIDWLIVGGESGPGARPMHPDWVRDLRDRCAAIVPCDDCERGYNCAAHGGRPLEPYTPPTRTAFFFKQWGEWEPWESDDPPFWRSVSTGTLLDGHHLPPEIIDGDPVGGWWAPLDGEDTLVTYLRAGKKAAGRVLDGRTWDEMPEVRS